MTLTVAAALLAVIACLAWKISQLHSELADLNGLIAAMLRADANPRQRALAALHIRRRLPDA